MSGCEKVRFTQAVSFKDTRCFPHKTVKLAQKHHCVITKSHRKFSMVSGFGLEDREEEALSAEAL